jgi:UDP-N-acetylglucosamine 4,6-dehydratase/5-epimerase
MTLSGRCTLISGGTGSFGNAVVTRLLAEDIGEIRIFSRDEKKQEDMRLAFNDSRLRFFIGDVRDYDSIHRAMKGVDRVFHAAALKQVPSCEFFPIEAVRTNVLGAENVMNAAIANGVRRVVLLSTDKAVYPINAMGMSKAMMEKLMVAKSRLQDRGDTILCATRYGNVMGSRGSVIPLFIHQIKQGKALTITDARMTRFMMSLEDSVDLVFHAFQHGEQGDTLIQKAPACTIGDLAQALKHIFGKDCSVTVIGTRHGEKLYESLLSREEMAKAEDTARYYRVPADNRDLNYNKYVVEGETGISTQQDYTSHNAERLNVEQMKALLYRLPFIQEQLHA